MSTGFYGEALVRAYATLQVPNMEPMCYLCALSEETAHPTVYHHLSQLSVDIQLSGLIKCREDSGLLIQLIQVIFRSLSWISHESAAIIQWTQVISS